MKKKLIQILTLLVVAVSVGSFVSCKDTNEDLYNQLRTETQSALAGNATVDEALRQRIDQLEGELAGLRTLAGCTCGFDATDYSNLRGDVTQAQADIQTLQGLVGGIDLSGLADAATVQGIDRLVGAMNLRLQSLESLSLPSFVATVSAIQTELQRRIGTVEQEIRDLKNDKVDALERLSKAEQALIDLEAWKTQVKSDIQNAQSKADEAFNLATIAKTKAEAALALSDRIDVISNALDLEKGAKDLANRALDEAIKAYKLAADVQTLAGKNEGRIDALEGDVAELKKLIEKNHDKIDENATKIATLEETVKGIEKNATDIKELIDKVNGIETSVTSATATANEALKKAEDAYNEAMANAGKISNLESQVAVNTDDIEELESAVKELKTAVCNLKSDVAANTQAIKDLTKNVEDMGTNIGKLSDKIDDMQKELNALKKEVGNMAAQCSSNLNEAKGYVDTQIATLKGIILAQVASDLKDYVQKNDLTETLKNYATLAQLGSYATKEDLEKYAKAGDLDKYATKDLLSGYATRDLLDQKIQKVMDEMYDDTELRNKIDALSDKVTANEQVIYLLNQWLLGIQSKVDGIVPRTELTDYYNKIDERIRALESQGSGITPADKEKLINELTEDLTNKLTTIINDKVTEKITDGGLADQIAEILAGDKFNFITSENIGDILAGDDFKFVTEDDIKKFKFVTEDDIKDFLTDEDIADFVKKDDIKSMISLAVSGLVSEEDFANAVSDITNLKARTGTLETLVGGVNVVTLASTVAGIDTRVTNLENNKVDKTTYNTDLSNIWTAIGTNQTDISTLNTAVNTITGKVTALEKAVDDLKTRVTATEGRLDAVESDIQTLTSSIAAIQAALDALKGQVTGIIVQGTYNPMFGTFSIPSNVQSNILVAYYGLPSNGGQFPTISSGNYVRPSEVLTAGDWAMIGSSVKNTYEYEADLPILNENGNAGKVYVTINPSSVDFTGITLPLVNTQEKESPIKLKGLRKSSDLLQFGLTRADNGFYEADAYVDNKTVMTGDNGLKLNREELKTFFSDVQEQIKNLASSFTTPGAHVDLGKMAIDVYQIIRDMKLDRNAIKCSYTTTGTNGNPVTNNVYSTYNLGATFLNPIGLSWGKDFNYITMPGYEAVDNLLNRLSRTAKDKIHVVVRSIQNNEALKKIVNFKIINIELQDISDDLRAKFRMEIGDDVTISGLTYRMDFPAGSYVDILFDKNLTAGGVPVNIPADRIIDMTNITVERPAIAVRGDIVAGQPVQMTLVIPAKNEVGIQERYVTFNLNDGSDPSKPADLSSSVTSTATGDVIVINSVSVGKITSGATAVGSNLITAGFPSGLTIGEVIHTENTVTPTLDLHFEVDMRDAMDELWGMAQGTIGDVNKMLQDLKDIVKDVNTLLEDLNNYEKKAGTAIDNAIDTYLRDYLVKINAKVVNFVNGINRRLGPLMVASNSGKGFKRLSESKEYPTFMSASDLRIYPTTKNMELIVPIARKHVAVTNVYARRASDGALISAQDDDGAPLVSVLQKVNNDSDRFNEVIDGGVRMLNVSGMQRDYIYEIAYSVLDFEGKISTRKYYVSIK